MIQCHTYVILLKLLQCVIVILLDTVRKPLVVAKIMGSYFRKLKTSRTITYNNLLRQFSIFQSCVILKDVPETYAEKQPPKLFFKERYSLKFRKIHRKAPVLESLFQ